MELDRNAKRRAHRAANLEAYREQERKQRDANRARYNETRQAWKERNPEKVRWIQRKLKFGVTQESWELQFELQDERCAICRNDHPGLNKDWATDHCHETGRLRGILCHPCNKALGFMKDQPHYLRAAADYIDAFNSLRKKT